MRLIERRITLLFVVFAVALGIAGIRALYLGTVKASDLREAAAAQQVDDLVVPAPRGSIRDRNGIDLAVSEPAISVAATPYLIENPARAAREIAPIIDRPVNEVLRKLSERDTGFVYLARRVPADREPRLEKLGIAGLELTPESRREYPRGWLASQILGSVGVDGNGLSGLESAAEDVLGGEDGRRRLVKDAKGDPIDLSEIARAKPGRHIKLTIDAGMQEHVEDVLAETGEKFDAAGASAIVLDPKTGDVLAMANWPTADPADVDSGTPVAHDNRAVTASYEPGSTFKPITVAGALEDKAVGASTQFNLPPQIQVADRTIGEAHPRGWVTLDTGGILAQSSNVGTVMIGQRLGARRFDKWVRKFGFGSSQDTGLPGEAEGIVPRPEDYSGSSMGNLPIGQGLAASPLQMAAAYGALANNGVYRQPRVIAEIQGEEPPKRAARRVVSASTAATVRHMLEGVVEDGGTAEEIEIPGYTVAGKTGTANKPDPETGGYSSTNYVASFAGFAPAKHPGVVVVVMVDEPRGAFSGADVAAPAWQEITSYALSYLRVPPD
jgi:cell division protein FtsI (penicillin-binding protein 3)